MGGGKSKEKNDAKSENYVVSGDLTRKPLDRGTEKPKESEPYPANALEAKELEGEIRVNEQGNSDISDERRDAEGIEDVTAQSSNTTTNIQIQIQIQMLLTSYRLKAQQGWGYMDEVNPKPKLLQHWTLFMSLLILIIALALHFSYANDSILDIDTITRRLKPEFEKQPEMSFRVIQTALEAVTETISTAPAIILLLAAKGAEKRSRQLGKKLVTAISPKYLNISGEDYGNLDYHVGKKKIDDLLHTLSENEFDAVLVEDLHLIPGSTALMFHSYCDHENAPFKRAVFVMTVASGNVIPIDSEIKFWEETANNRLMKSWSDIEEDQVVPLLARLTVSIAAITADN